MREKYLSAAWSRLAFKRTAAREPGSAARNCGSSVSFTFASKLRGTNNMVSVDRQLISRGLEIRYFISAVRHSLARMTGQSSHTRSRESTNMVGLASGKLGVSARVNRLVHFFEPRAM